MRRRFWLLLHRILRKPVSERFIDRYGETVERTLDLRGLPHSYCDCPSVCQLSRDRSVQSLEWMIHGKPGRKSGGPTMVWIDDEGQVLEELYLDAQGRRHSRNDKPSHTRYFDDGSKKREAWHYRDVLHREGDLPANVFYFEGTNQVESEHWHFLGPPWRDGGKPDTIFYWEDGSVISALTMSLGIEEIDIRKLSDCELASLRAELIDEGHNPDF